MFFIFVDYLNFNAFAFDYCWHNVVILLRIFGVFIVHNHQEWVLADRFLVWNFIILIADLSFFLVVRVLIFFLFVDKLSELVFLLLLFFRQVALINEIIGDSLHIEQIWYQSSGKRNFYNSKILPDKISHFLWLSCFNEKFVNFFMMNHWKILNWVYLWLTKR